MNNIYQNIDMEMNILFNVVKILNNLDIKYKIKGNVLLHLNQQNNEYYDVFRGTRDIDMHTEYADALKIANYFEEFSPLCTIISTKSGLVKSIDNLNLGNIVKIDINSEENLELNTKYTEIYQIKDEKFYGNSIEGILKDKISAISTQKVSRRFKDVVDLYIIFKLLKFTEEKIIRKLNEYKTGNFEEYWNPETIRAKELFKGLYFSEEKTIEDIYSFIGNTISKSTGSENDKLDNVEGGLKWQ